MMLDEGIFAERMPAAVFGIHVGISIPGGQFAVKPGPMMAAADRYQITVKGKQTHGARPWDGVDPIVVASQIVLGLQTIASRQVDVTKAPSIISVGRISGGIRNNVIPDKVELEGTIRTFDPDMRDYIHKAVERTARLIAESAGAEIEFELEQGPPSLQNNAELTALVMPALERASGHPCAALFSRRLSLRTLPSMAVSHQRYSYFLATGPKRWTRPPSQPTTHRISICMSPTWKTVLRLSVTWWSIF